MHSQALSPRLCEMEHQCGHDAIWRGVCHDLERIFQGTKFFFLILFKHMNYFVSLVGWSLIMINSDPH